MDDRRYGQRGYRDHEKKRQGKPQEPARSGAPAMVPTGTISRCADCGTALPPMTDPNGQCPKCRAELHSCRQCAHFDPGAHFQCTEPVPERIADKRARNPCTFFLLQVAVERNATGSARPDDPRRAFDNLFKKK